MSTHSQTKLERGTLVLTDSEDRRHRKGASAQPNVTTGVLARRGPPGRDKLLVTQNSLWVPKTLTTPNPGADSILEREQIHMQRR